MEGNRQEYCVYIHHECHCGLNADAGDEGSGRSVTGYSTVDYLWTISLWTAYTATNCRTKERILIRVTKKTGG